MTSAADEHRRSVVDQFTQQAVSFSQMQNHSPELILQAAGLGPNDNVLDVACGPGLMACEFAAVARHVTGIDLTPAMIERAQALQESRRQTNITWLLGDVTNLPIDCGSFSLVFTRYSLHHILEPKEVVAEMVRVCSPGGRVVVVDVFTRDPEQAELFNHVEKLRDPSHVRALSLEELLGLLRGAGLSEVSRQFYKHEFELEQALQGSFPNPGDADRVRQIYLNDLHVNHLGLGICRRDGQIYLAYPIVVLVGSKR